MLASVLIDLLTCESINLPVYESISPALRGSSIRISSALQPYIHYQTLPVLYNIQYTPVQCYTSSCYLFQVPSITRRSFANHRNHRSAYLEHRDSTKLGRNNELSAFNLVLPALGLEGKENLCLQCDSKFFYFEFISVVRLLYILFSYGTFKEAKSRKPFERYECILVSNTQLIQCNGQLAAKFKSFGIINLKPTLCYDFYSSSAN